jgi:alpha-aminoadipic semialdehyde synthase
MAALSRTSKRHLTLPSLTIGLRREDPSRIWERRCPLTPDAVHDLVHNENTAVLVQNCERRVFPINEFVKVCSLRFYCYVVLTHLSA